MKAEYRPYLIRFLLVLGVSLALVLAINEGFYLLSKEEHDRAPQTVQLTIPLGTADLVADGDSVPTIPEEMVFIEGDVLEVINEDKVDHQLGPIWVPSGATGRLVLEDANKYAYSCSFAPSRYLGIDVRQATTMGTRLTALGLATPPMAIIIFIYSLLAFPVISNTRVQTQEQEV
ncbi:MAG: hypothetical protein PVF74_09055 [Anaerolineales bacterium]|jgi:hypothetical protein